jgi:hypothetical protein
LIGALSENRRGIRAPVVKENVHPERIWRMTETEGQRIDGFSGSIDKGPLSAIDCCNRRYRRTAGTGQKRAKPL